MLPRAVPHAQKDIPLDNIESVLLTNECTVCKAYSVFESRGLSEKGVICVTNLQILFITTKKTSLRSSRGLSTGACILEKIPLGMIDTLTQNTNTNSNNNPFLSLTCKDGRICNFLVGSIEDVERLYHHIYTFAFPGSNSKLFAFYNRPNKSDRKVIDFYPNEQESDDEEIEEEPKFEGKDEKQDNRSSSEDLSGFFDDTETETDCEWDEDENEGEFMMYDGWDVFHPMREYLRLGVRVSGREKRKKLPRYLREQLKEDKSNLVNSPLYRSQWRLSKVNSTYQFANSYPRYFAVPRLITDEQLVSARNLRNEDRVPILSYLHPETYASICRGSQLFVGVHGPRNSMDEYLFSCIQRGGLNPNAAVYILDCRPQNPSRGGRGCENLKYYSNCEYEYLGICSLKKLRESIQSVWELVRECQAVFAGYTRNEQTTVAIIDALRDNRTLTWVNHIQKIIRASRRVLQLVQQGSSVVVHCPDGRDRTPIVVSLAMLQLDPFFRTIEGFEVLVEKEWSAAGHRFQTRSGHGIENNNDPQRAPIFIVFLDCVWQLLHQHPDSFEFNDEYLLSLASSLYSCRFGTFLYDSEQERKDSDVFRNTCSLWSFTNCNPKFLNPRYRQLMTERATSYAKISLIHVDCDRVQLWLGYFFPQLSAPVISSIHHWQGNDFAKTEQHMTEEYLRHRVTELEEAQKKLLATIESFKRQNQELFTHNEKLCLQNLELQKTLASSSKSAPSIVETKLPE